jgi:hypothetical protein
VDKSLNLNRGEDHYFVEAIKKLRRGDMYYE